MIDYPKIKYISMPNCQYITLCLLILRCNRKVSADTKLTEKYFQLN